MTVGSAPASIPLAADSLPELFRHAALTLGDQILATGKIPPESHLIVHVESRNQAELFQDFLDELTFIWKTERFGWQGVDVELHSDRELTAQLRGAKVKRSTPTLDEIPSPQYNVGVIERDPKGMWHSTLSVAPIPGKE